MKDLFDIQQLTQFEFGAIVITVLVTGLVFGCLIAYGLLKRSNSPNAAAAVKIQEEFEEYKEKVDDHFDKTSEMFKDVTTQYKKLYDHMAVGAIALGNADTIAMPRLEMQDPEPEEKLDVVFEQPQADTAEEITDEDTLSSDNNSDNSDVQPSKEQITEQSEETKTS